MAAAYEMAVLSLASSISIVFEVAAVLRVVPARTVNPVFPLLAKEDALSPWTRWTFSWLVEVVQEEPLQRAQAGCLQSRSFLALV